MGKHSPKSADWGVGGKYFGARDLPWNFDSKLTSNLKTLLAFTSCNVTCSIDFMLHAISVVSELPVQQYLLYKETELILSWKV